MFPQEILFDEIRLALAGADLAPVAVPPRGKKTARGRGLRELLQDALAAAVDLADAFLTIGEGAGTGQGEDADHGAGATIWAGGTERTGATEWAGATEGAAEAWGHPHRRALRRGIRAGRPGSVPGEPQVCLYAGSPSGRAPAGRSYKERCRSLEGR